MLFGRRSQFNTVTCTEWNASVLNEQEADGFVIFGVQPKYVWILCICGWDLLFLQAAIRIPNCFTLISGFIKYRGRCLVTLNPGAGLGNFRVACLLASLSFDQ